MAPRPVLILLPPSEGKVTGGSGEPWRAGGSTMAQLDTQRAEVLTALDATNPPGGSVAGLATMAAIDRYTGVLYKELDAASLDTRARRRLERRVLIASGLWGLVAPTDPIPHYRLKMGARLDPLGRLASWWRPHLTAALAPRVRRAVVWDLLPIEHSAAIDWTGLEPHRRVTVRFLDEQGRTISHWNKLLKGSLVRWLVGPGVADIGTLSDFDHPLGYRLDATATVADGSAAHVVLRQRPDRS